MNQEMKMTRQVYDRVASTIGRRPVESGGILGSSDGIHIDYFFFDATAKTTGGTYTPDTGALNYVLTVWAGLGVRLAGFIHSHPEGFTKPSHGDYLYVKEIMKAMNIHDFFMPIVTVNHPPDGRVEIHPYSFREDITLREQPLAVARDYAEEPPAGDLEHLRLAGKERFDRVQSLYPLETMRRKTVVLVGCGGARQFGEELARTGVGRFILIDSDTVSAANIATQQTYLSEVGRSKAEVLRERILDINPEAEVIAVPRFLDDSMADEEFLGIVGVRLLESPKNVLLCGCTDNFHAQARSAALAMKFGTPYLAAQLYRGGMAAEVYFSYPGVTNNGCPRCALSSRYEAYQNGFQNDTTSEGVPIFATTRVNAIKGQIALMLLLYHADCVYGRMLDAVADRNFAMIRMSPRADKALGLSIFKEAVCPKSGLSFFDETVWIPQTPNDGKDGNPVCPLCGGTGDLTALKGKLGDTRTDWGK